MLEPAPSFRDPSGCCCFFGGRVLRRVTVDAVPEFEKFLQTNSARQFIAGRKFVSTRRLDEAETAALRQAPDLIFFLPPHFPMSFMNMSALPFQVIPTNGRPKCFGMPGA